MAFVMEWVEHFIRSGMEDPRERDERFASRVRELKSRAEALKETWTHPVKPYGFWNLDKNNHKLLLDMRLSNLTGRQNAYDVVTKDPSAP